MAARPEHPLDEQLAGEGPVDRQAGAGVEDDVDGVRVVGEVEQPGGDGDAAFGGQDQLEFQLALDDGVVHGGLTSCSAVCAGRCGAWLGPHTRRERRTARV
ncbi:hypothetical protein GCM10020254_52760 [Streptomyces goshikiensis]